LGTLTLHITSFTDNANWEWRLEDENETFLADHIVALDRGSSEYSGFIDLYRFVRWNEAGTNERDLVQRVARWIRSNVWGPVGDAIVELAKREPVTVRLMIPAEAHALLFLPLEIGLRLDEAPAAMDVSLVCDADGDGKSPAKRPVGDRLRMLGIFSMPTDQAALNVRRERHELVRLVHRVARTAGRAVELRILQYGVTRESIEEVMEEGDGWDLIHFSGHGLPAGLVLEHEDGSADVIKSIEIADLLWPTRAQLKLVTLSSCESGAAEAAYALHLLGITSGNGALREEERGEREDSLPPLPAVAQGISSRLGCATLAMRYPVEDEFAIDLSAGLYEGLLARDQPLSRALQRALNKVRKRTDRTLSALSLATPALFGAASLDLKLSPPPGEPMAFDPARATMAEFPLEPENFVGRVGPLARASAALAPKNSSTGVLFHGMAGAGKTACALELAYRHRNLRFEGMAWYAAPTEGTDVSEALSRFAASLESQINGLELAHVINDKEKLEAFLPRLQRLLADHSLLLMLDNVESLLTPDGRWRDPRWELIISSLIGHDGLSRVVLTSRVPPQGMLSDPRIHVESIHSLSASESALLARQMPNLGSLLLNGLDGDLATGRQLVRRTLQVVQGNPKLIELADAQAADPKVLEERIKDADTAWNDKRDLDVFFATGEPAKEIAAEDFRRVIQRWAGSIIDNLSDLERTAFHIVCCLEDRDRREPIAEAIWSVLGDRLGEEAPSEPGPLFSTVARQGLMDFEPGADARFGIHPAVESSALESISDELRTEVDHAAAAVWVQVFEKARKTHDAPAIVVSCLGVAPYFLRQKKPGQAALCIGMAIAQDTSMPVLATAMPLLRRAVGQATGTPDELAVREVLVRATAAQHSKDVIPELQTLIELAREQGDRDRTESLRAALFAAFLRLGHLSHAEQVLAAIDAEERSELPPWSQLASKAMRLQVRQARGHDEEVLEELANLREQMETMEESDGISDILSWPIREVLLDVGVSAALALQEWETALELNEAVQASEMERNAPRLARDVTAMNSFGPLMELNRLDEAEQVLVDLRATLEESEDLRRMGEVFGSWAILEMRRGHTEDAIAFEYKALRLHYLIGEPVSIGINHHNLATDMVKSGGNPEEIVAHRVVAALILYQIQSADYLRRVASLTGSVRSFGVDALPQSFEELCARMDRIEGCKFRDLFEHLPATAPTGEAALEILRKDLDDLLEATPT
jgi:hypothetical protein